MKKLLTLCFLFLTVPAWGATYYVATTGNDTTGTGAIGAPYRTINKGLTVLAAGDTLLVRAGTYIERIGNNNRNAIPSGLDAARPTTIAAYPGAPPFEVVTLDGSGGSRGHFVVLEGTHHDIKVSGFVFDGKSTATVNNIQGGVDGAMTRFTYTYNELKNIFHVGLGINGDGHIIQHNTLHHTGMCTRSSSDPATALANCLGAQPHAFYFAATNSLIDDNIVYQGGDIGIQIYHGGSAGAADNTIISNNDVYDNCNMAGQGCAGMTIWDGSNQKVFGNKVHNQSTTGSNNGGINIGRNCTGCLVYNNLVYNNPGDGIANVFSTSVGTYNNTIYGNGLAAISIGSGSASNNTVRNNILFSNSNNSVSVGTAPGLVQDHNLTTNPFFLNAANADFHLTSSSTGAIGQSTDLSATFTTDFAGTTRTAPWDIGAYKYGAGTVTMTITPTSPISSPAISTTTSFNFAGTTTGTVTSVGITLNGVSQGNATGTATWTKTVTLVPGNNTLIATATDGTTNVTTTNIVKMTGACGP
jgi:hypothetical protein